jgi:ankyrin repeat protein
VIALLRAGAKVNAQQQNPHFYHGWTPICFAVIKSNLAMVQLFFQHDADVRPCGLPVSTMRNPKIVDLLLQHGADPNDGRDQGSRSTPLWLAAANWWADPAAYTNIIRLLLQYGADPNVRNSFGGTPLLQIQSSPFSALTQNPGDMKTMPDVSEYLTQVVNLLVEYGAGVDDTQVLNNDDACCSAPQYRDGVPYCRVLSPQGCNLMAQYAPCEPGRLEHYDTGITSLMQAVQSNNQSLVLALLNAGADVSRKDAKGRSVLEMATTEVMKTLLRTGHPPESGVPVSGASRRPVPSQSAVTRVNPTTVTAHNSSEPAVHTEIQRDVHKNEFICYQGPNRRTVLKQFADSTFGNEKLLDVVIDDRNHLMSNDSQGPIATEITNALLIWRRMCIECATANAAVLRINGTVYIDPNLKSILDTVDYSTDYEAQRLPAFYTAGCSPTAPLNFSPSPAQAPVENRTTSTPMSPETRTPARGWPIDLSESFLSTRLGLRVPLFPYVKIGADDPGVLKICSAAYADLPAILKGARAAFECPADAQMPRASRAYMKIKLDDGYTTCGPDDNIVGCESNEFLLEMNASRYRFVEHGTERPLLGHGSILVDLQIVLMHEFGHWVGIQQHLGTPHNIMSAYLSDALCIDEAVVQALANSTQPNSAQAHPQALFYRNTSSPSQSSLPLRDNTALTDDLATDSVQRESNLTTR